MTSDSWMAKALDHVAKEQYLNIIGMRSGKTEAAERYSNTRVFRNLQLVESLIDRRNPIAVVMIKEDEMGIENYCVMVQEAEVVVYPVQVHYTTGACIGGQWYYWCHLSNVEVAGGTNVVKDVLTSIHRVILLLPLQQQLSTFADCPENQCEEDVPVFDDWEIPLFFPQSPPNLPRQVDHSFFAIAMDLVNHSILNEKGNWSLPVVWPISLNPGEFMPFPAEDEATDGTTRMQTI
jgi:hypothetical protein